MRLGLDGRVAVVTGAGSGIGRATALLLAEEGCRVVAVDRDEASLEALARALGESARVVAADIAAPDAPDLIVGAAVDSFGRLDVLVASAGIWETSPLDRLDDETWHRVLDVNLTAPFRCARAALPVMIANRWGRIVTVSSIAARTGGGAASAAYVASKAGVVGLTRSLARHGGRYGVTANCVSPGVVDTPMIAVADAEQTRATLEQMPVGRLGDPKEVAAVVALLSSDVAGFVNGAHVDVNGGLVMGQ